MQTTLLSIAIAIILALLAALVGPHFIDWNHYRGEFEQRASRLMGLQVRVAGPIELRLLPTPTMTLQKVDISRPGDAGAVRARKLGIEFALGALARGEWRASDVRIEGAELALSLDASGRLDWPAPLMGFDPDAVSIQRLDIVDSRAILADSASGSGIVLEKLEFTGELRSLAGPVKGEGAFVLHGQHYPYRISTNRPSEDGVVRVRLNLDPIDRPMIADADASIWIEQGIPRFEGTLQVTRPVGRAPEGSGTLITEPWKLSSRVKGDSRAAILEQVEFQYGPDDRSIKLRGDARLTFGRTPQLDGVLSSPQIDLDRVLALPEPVRRRPLAAVKSFTDYLAGTQRLPIPVKLGISVETLTLGGANLHRVTGDLKADADNWDVESLDFRAPGAAQIRLSGRLGTTARGITFAGPARIEARDSRALVAWLTDRADALTTPPGPFRAEGVVNLGPDMIAVDRLKADIDRMTLEGRLSYAWASGEQPARIEAVLSAPEIDFDRAQSLLNGVFADTAFEWPREGTLAIKVGKASLAGIEASGADVSMQFNSQGFDIERLALGDLGGAALAVKGRIDTSARAPRGAVTLDLDARSLDGLVAVLDKVAPGAAEELRRRAARLAPAKLQVALSFNPASAAVGAATFKLDGTAGGFKVALQGNAGAPSEGFALGNLSRLAASKLDLSGRIESADGGALVGFLGLDRLFAVDARSGRLNFAAAGPLDRELTVEGHLFAGGLDVAAKGQLRLSTSNGPAAALDLKIANANIRSPRPPAAGRPVETLAVALAARLAFAEGTVGLTQIAGKIAGSEISGRLKLGLAQPASIEGEIEVGPITLPAVIASVIGLPANADAGAASWPTEPFDTGLLGSLTGQVAVKSARVTLTPKLAAENVRGTLRFDHSEFAIEDIDGALANGRVSGSLVFRRAFDGLSATSQIKLASTDAGALLPGSGPPAIAGRLALDVVLEGSGRSAVALMNSLKGGGTFTLVDGRIARLDPAAFDAIIRSVDQGLPIDGTRIRDRMETALANGNLALPLAEGEISVAAGQARIGNVLVRTERADLAVNGVVDLAGGTLDARVNLLGPEGAGDAPTGRPEVGITLKGPIEGPRRTLDVAVLASWLALRAVEQQAKKLDALESGREQPVPPTPVVVPPAADPAPPKVAPPVVTPPPAPAPGGAPAIAAPDASPARVRPPASPDAPAVPAAPAAPRVRPGAAADPPVPAPPAAPARVRPPAPPAPPAAATEAKPAPALPPPVDIRPPTPRSRPEGGARSEPAPPPAPPPTTFLERLLSR